MITYLKSLFRIIPSGDHLDFSQELKVYRITKNMYFQTSPTYWGVYQLSTEDNYAIHLPKNTCFTISQIISTPQKHYVLATFDQTPTSYLFDVSVCFTSIKPLIYNSYLASIT